MEYNFTADLLNKFLLLTPWVQAILGLGSLLAVIAVLYVIERILTVLLAPMRRGANKGR